MNRPALISFQKQEYPILIFDKNNLIGEEIAQKLNNENPVVLVSKTISSLVENIIHIPYLKRIPTIPDNLYSQILIIDEKLESTKNVLQGFINKAKKDNSGLVLITNYKHISNQFAQKYLMSYDKAKIVVLGDVFSSQRIINENNEINKFIAQIKTSGKLRISGDGTKEIRPVSLEDVVTGVLKTIFNSSEFRKIFYVFPKNPITQLSLAHLFLKKYPEIDLDFAKDSDSSISQFNFRDEGAYVLDQKYNLEEKIKNISFENIVLSKENHQDYAQKIIRKKLKLPSVKILLFLVLLILFPLFSTLAFAFIGKVFLGVAFENIQKGRNLNVNNVASIANYSFIASNAFANILAEEAKLVGQEQNTVALLSKITFAKKISQSIVSLSDSFIQMKNILNGKENNPKAKLSILINEIKNAMVIYNQAKQDSLISNQQALEIDNLFNIISPTIDLWPEILGFNQQKKYLVLFQNSNELRPGGGLIETYGLLTLDKGKIINYKIYDVLDADRQLREHVDPPFALRRYMPIKDWYLRDSNFNVDFSKGAITSAIFLNSQTRENVNGVIGVDLFFLKNLLSVTGPLKISEQSEMISESNIPQAINKFPLVNNSLNATQNKDFIQLTQDTLVQKFIEDNNISYLNLLNSFAKSIYEKHLLFSFNDLDQQVILSLNGWSSSLADQREVAKGKLNDFFGLSEANIGSNKVSNLITRSISQNVEIQDDGVILEHIVIKYKNSSNNNSPSGGNYKNYQRLILPSGAELTKILINGKSQTITPAIIDPKIYEKKNFTAPKGIEVDRQYQGQNTIYGFLVNVKAGETKTLTMEYLLGQKFNINNSNNSYSLKLFKQPGIDSYTYDLSLTFPNTFKVMNKPTWVKLSDNMINFRLTVNTDMNLSVGFAKN